MKSLTMRWMIAVAALAVAAGTASAQTFKAQIPMSFRVNDAVLAPGAYEIRIVGGSSASILYVQNAETSRSIMVMAGVKGDAPKEWREDGAPRLAFTCVDQTCSLSRLWNGRDSFAYRFRVRDLPTVEAHRATFVTLAMIKVR